MPRMPARVAITGASGLVGTALSRHLLARGDEVLHLVRREPRTSAEVRWDPIGHRLDPADLAGIDAVVHLAGAGIGDHRWTRRYRRQILSSRVEGTHTVAQAVARLGPSVTLLSASGIDYYGHDRGETILTEASRGGDGFLAEVARAWEGATGRAEQADARVVHLRSGIVLAPHGGAMTPLLRLSRVGLSGPLGSGNQWWSWISLHDQVRAIAHLIDDPAASGPVNLVSPNPTRQRNLVRALAHELHRPALVPAPGSAVRLAIGGFAATVLGSKRVLPQHLTRAGFTFEHADLDRAMAALVHGS